MRSLTVEATDENLSVVNDFIHEALSGLNPSEEFFFKFDLAVEELFVNIAHYAYAPSKGSVTVRCAASGEPPVLTVSFSDSGIPYNPLLRSDPDITQDLCERRIGGMGVYLTKKYMDSVSYERKDGMNVITIQKAVG